MLLIYLLGMVFAARGVARTDSGGVLLLDLVVFAASWLGALTRLTEQHTDG